MEITLFKTIVDFKLCITYIEGLSTNQLEEHVRNRNSQTVPVDLKVVDLCPTELKAFRPYCHLRRLLSYCIVNFKITKTGC